jgi:hypothetical protein
MKLPESWVETTVGKVVLDLQPGFAQKPGEDDVVPDRKSMFFGEQGGGTG